MINEDCMDYNSDDDMDEPKSINEDDDNSSISSNEAEGKMVYLPSHPLNENEELVYDESAYIMLHQAQTGAPILSFDILKNNDDNNDFPLKTYIVAGTQAPRTHVNNIILLKMFNLHSTGKDKSKDKVNNDDDDDDDDECLDDDEDEGDEDKKKPKMSFTFVKHPGCVNRIRSKQYEDCFLTASWSEVGCVSIWDLKHQLQAVDDVALLNEYEKNDMQNLTKPLFSFNGHKQEGYAMDWNPIIRGILATGDCHRDIFIWKPSEEGVWHINQQPLLGHSQSVEDIQWSPNEESVLASCSVDKSIRIWDIRASPLKACMLTCENAHLSDVNVISWNKKEPFIVSGGEDGYLHVWDLRQFKTKKPVGTFKHHTAPITTVEWYTKDPTVFASGGEDDQIAIWDLSLENDSDVESESKLSSKAQDNLKDLPPQLLFIHQGQTEIKELHWHPQLSGVMLSTALTGLNIFKTISVQ